MPEALASSASPPLKSVKDIFPPLLVGLFLALVVLGFIAIPIMAARWMKLPFMGAFVNQNLFIPYFVGLMYLASSLYIFVLRWRDHTGQAFVLFTATAALAIAGQCLSRSQVDVLTSQRLTVLWTISLALAGGSLINLALVFPQVFRVVSRWSLLRWCGYLPTLLLAAIALLIHYNPSIPLRYVLAWRVEYIFTGLAALTFLGCLIYWRTTSASPIIREQSSLVLLGWIVSFSPLAIWFILTFLLPEMRFTPYLLLPTVFFPFMVGYVLLRRRLLDTDALLSRWILYLFLSGLAVVGYAAITIGVALFFNEAIHPTNPFVVGLMVFLLILLFNPLRNRLQQVVDSVFFRGQDVYRERIASINHELAQATNLAMITGILRKYAEQSLAPNHLNIFLYDALSDEYKAVAAGQGGRRPPDHRSNGGTSKANSNSTTTVPASGLHFAPQSPLTNILSQRLTALFLAEISSGELPEALQPERGRLGLLGAQLFVPLQGRKSLLGWLALGPRASGEVYKNRDLTFLEALCNQASVAVERAQVVADLERRVHEMNVLTRVAQAINFTVFFDDILELIFTQTNQVIPIRDFRLTLLDRNDHSLRHAFFLENNERLSELEGKPLPPKQGLEAEVIYNQRSLLVEDYPRACRSRGLKPDMSGVYTWMGVLLAAGDEVVGAISLGNRDPAVVYTAEQRSLLQTIADQATGAIIKARLLQESETRAHQLATLNEIGRGLTSNLDLTTVLDQILNSAVEILNCTAGSLLMVDQQTGELIFEVVIGPVASDLIGKRLPPGTGLAGEVAQTGKAIIAVDVRRLKEWSAQTDAQTGFDTQNMLVVPMLLKDRVIGVIEVINKQDGTPFNPSDQELLITYSNQATIAIENARLYTMTDQALAARVEELSVMQRIDRELNASLDLDRAMHITLEWAINQSKADAGFTGIVENGFVQILASQGYIGELGPFIDPTPETAGQGGRRPPDHRGSDGVATRRLTELEIIQQALQTGQLRIRNPQISEIPEVQGALLTGARNQAVVPIHREETVIGVLLLESRQAGTFSPETLAFLSRLSDHAAIAIANAQLYAEVEAANLAKSKFVSFVAHELKNPMASIKGYTELVAGGMAGAVNDMQKSFLSTVRANVDRMNTIVTDLNDLTKIQVGNLRLEFRAVQVKEVIDEVVRSMKRQMDEKEQHLVIQLADELPMLWCDQNRLNQVLTNLMSNAFKYTPKGGKISLGVEPTQPGGEKQTGGAALVHIWVKDTGIGIAPEDQPKIFQQYFRTEISKEVAPGTGLGLNITRSLVEMQGGRIWFESELGKGTTFHLTIPIAEASI